MYSRASALLSAIFKADGSHWFVMLALLLLGSVLAVTLLAKRNYGKKSYHRDFRLRRVTISSQSAAGALATGAVVVNNIINAVADKLRLISIDASYSWSGIGANVDDGCSFGFAHSDYTAAEIEECLEAITSIDLGDKVAQERANRLVRYIGTIGNTGGAPAAGGASFNDGKRVKVRLNWLLSAGDQLGLWIRNASGVVWTTGSQVTISGDLWVKD